MFNFKQVIDIRGGYNKYFVYTGSGCRHVLGR